VDLITVEREAGLAFRLNLRGHEFRSDMSVDDGGRDAAPSPAELMAGSLGACIAMMVQGYCDTHGYSDGEVSVSLTVELGDDPKRVAGFVIDLELPDDVPVEKRDVIMRVAEKCTIHETLVNPPRVDIDIT
jgi:uncharacterized OsmC-like protein